LSHCGRKATDHRSAAGGGAQAHGHEENSRICPPLARNGPILRIRGETWAISRNRN
jgi:hypothetical protein